MKLIDREHLIHPWHGLRRMTLFLRQRGYDIGRDKVRRLMRSMGIRTIYPKPKLSVSNPNHSVYPYLLRDMDISSPNQVWSTDITYIPMEKGFLYLIAYIDWFSRYIVSWDISNTMDKEFCIAGLEDGISSYPPPGILNADQGSQFTSHHFLDVVKANNIRMSHDGRRRWLDNVVIERFWRSIKYECIYINCFTTGKELHKALTDWIHYYNYQRPHMAWGGKTPAHIYLGASGAP